MVIKKWCNFKMKKEDDKENEWREENRFQNEDVFLNLFLKVKSNEDIIYIWKTI